MHCAPWLPKCPISPTVYIAVLITYERVWCLLICPPSQAGGWCSLTAASVAHQRPEYLEWSTLSTCGEIKESRTKVWAGRVSSHSSARWTDGQQMWCKMEENSPLSEAERQPEEARVTDRVGVRNVDMGHERNKSRPQEEWEWRNQPNFRPQWLVCLSSPSDCQ